MVVPGVGRQSGGMKGIRDGTPRRELPVQRLARAFEGAVKELLHRVGSGIDDDLRDQLTRAASSVLLNLNEAVSHETRRQKLHFFRIAKGSLGECLGALHSDTIRRAARGAPAREALRLARNHGSQLMGQLARLTRYFSRFT